MSVIVSVQSGGERETYLRAQSPSMKRSDIIETISEMLADREKYTIGKLKGNHSNSNRRKKKAPVLRGDEHAVVNTGLETVVEAALS
jgi:hypothetical protein